MSSRVKKLGESNLGFAKTRSDLHLRSSKSTLRDQKRTKVKVSGVVVLIFACEIRRLIVPSAYCHSELAGQP